MIQYEIVHPGLAQTMVMVHGFSQSKEIFEAQVKHFGDRFRLVLIDLRGHGASLHDGPFGVEEYSDDVEEVFRFLNLRGVIYWGTHTGASVGLSLYFRNRDFISRLILEGAVIPGMPTPDIVKNIDRAKDVARLYGLDKAKADWLKNAEWFSHMNSDPISTRFEAHKEIIARFPGRPWLTDECPRKAADLRARLLEIAIPILAYNGEFDMQEFFMMADLLGKEAAEILVLRIPRSGGFPLWENPQAVNQAVESWIDRAY